MVFGVLGASFSTSSVTSMVSSVNHPVPSQMTEILAVESLTVSFFWLV